MTRQGTGFETAVFIEFPELRDRLLNHAPAHTHAATSRQ